MSFEKNAYYYKQLKVWQKAMQLGQDSGSPNLSTQRSTLKANGPRDEIKLTEYVLNDIR